MAQKTQKGKAALFCESLRFASSANDLGRNCAFLGVNLSRAADGQPGFAVDLWYERRHRKS
jgi:hypothetical protein